MSILDDLKELLAIANLKVLSSNYSGDGAKAELERLSILIAEALVESQEALAKAQQALAFTLLAAGAALTWADKKPVIRKVQAADAKARAALRLDGLTKAMQ